MQNKRSKGIRNFVKGKGYYIVLLLCAVAVGVTGYFLLSRSDPTPSTNESSVLTPSVSTNVKESTREPATDVLATEPDETPSTQESQQTESPRARPVGGDAVCAFAADHLAFNETTRDWRTHEGIDYAATLGQTVVAAADGTVYTIYEDEHYGMTVVLRHPDGYTTHYANLSEEIPVTVGQTVQAGDTVGTVGQTACTETATEPHLHFAVYCNNIPQDSEEFLKET